MELDRLHPSSRRRWMAKIRRGPDRRGPWWAEILAGIAQSYPACCYVEIGVEHGTSVSVVAPCCGEVHGCDVADRAEAMPRGSRFWHMASDDFFARYDGSPPDLVFIDGGHSYAQARRDYENALRIIAPGGTLALHDTCPESEDATAADLCGEVWRLRDEITAYKVTFETFPGLTLVRPDK